MSRLLFTIATGLLAGIACAAPFADPTQPPVLRGAVEVGTPAGQRIESILIAPDRRVAIISGQQVTIGSQFGSSVVVRITETEVVLRGNEGEQTLRLFPELARDSAATGKKARVK